LSLATQAELETLPRIGPATAQRIIAWRDTHGPFRTVDDLLAVSGIGPATLEGFRALVIP
jgi:competence protein ComEA